MDKKNVLVVVFLLLIVGMSICLVRTKEKALSQKDNGSNNEIKEEVKPVEEDTQVETPVDEPVEEPIDDSKKEPSNDKPNNKPSTNKDTDEPVNKQEDNTVEQTPQEEIEEEEIKEEIKEEEFQDLEKPNTNLKRIKVDNRCANTAQALELIYQDREYDYYLTSISSGCIYVTVNNKEYTLKNAITNNIVTVYDLEDNGFKFYKKEKNLVTS